MGNSRGQNPLSGPQLQLLHVQLQPSATTCVSWIVVKCIKLLFLRFPLWVLLGLRSIILSDSTGSHKVCFSHFAVNILTSSFLQTFSGLGHSLIVWRHVHCTTYAQPIPCFTSPPGSTITNGGYCDPLFCSAILTCAAFLIFLSLFSWSLFPVCVYTFALYLFPFCYHLTLAICLSHCTRYNIIHALSTVKCHIQMH